MWCYDEFSCNYRYKNAGYSMSSISWKGKLFPTLTWSSTETVLCCTDSFRQGGIFEDNPAKSPLAGVRPPSACLVFCAKPLTSSQANKAFVTYCSSDAWVGDAAAYGFQFRGARIVDAVLASLVAKGMGNSTVPSRLVFGGCSAGGRGAAFSLDYVPAVLAAAGVPPGAVSTVGLLDAALWIDIPPEIDGVVSQQCQTAALAQMVNATRFGDACAARYTGDEAWKCLFGAYRMPFVTTPYLMQASQLDTFQIEININAGGAMLPPTTPAQFDFAARFQAAAKAVLAGLPTAAQRASGVFSPACFHHCVTDAASFWNIQIGRRSFRDVFAAWFLNGTAPLHVVDACSGWRCGACSAKRSTKGGKLKPGHGANSPAQTALNAAVSGAPRMPPPAPAKPDPWGWTPAQSAAGQPPPAICVEAGLVYSVPPAPAPAAAAAEATAFLAEGLSAREAAQNGQAAPIAIVAGATASRMGSKGAGRRTLGVLFAASVAAGVLCAIGRGRGPRAERTRVAAEERRALL